MYHRSFCRFLLLPLLFLLSQCATPPKATRDLSKPDLTVHVGALNLSDLSGRIEKKDVADLAKILKREGVEVLVVYGLTRYPGVRTRVDLVEELGSAADMRQAVGEMMNNSGRQTVNVVFSTYPINSSDHQDFKGVTSADYEGALHAFVDGGIRDIQIVGAKLPPKAPTGDQTKCIRMIASKRQTEKRTPMIVAGNLPSAEAARNSGPFEDTGGFLGNPKSGTPKIWYSGEDLLPRSGRTVTTGFGMMSIVEFGLFR